MGFSLARRTGRTGFIRETSAAKRRNNYNDKRQRLPSITIAEKRSRHAGFA
jgi:hypothetical protein